MKGRKGKWKEEKGNEGKEMEIEGRKGKRREGKEEEAEFWWKLIQENTGSHDKTLRYITFFKQKHQRSLESMRKWLQNTYVKHYLVRCFQIRRAYVLSNVDLSTNHSQIAGHRVDKRKPNEAGRKTARVRLVLHRERNISRIWNTLPSRLILNEKLFKVAYLN